ncbi:substrate-binding periplasmic protein [Inhella sp.]|uniref:substrate-binding periplasmic protein n=1 Tax=Inhella sp. TaxID=1921806 RepID=UPI0035B268F8
MPDRRHLLLGLSALPFALKADPAPLQVVTGDLPPFAIEGQGDRPGFLVELTETLMAQAGWPVKVQFFPWARAMQMALAQPRTLILPLTRTPEREPQYQWLVKLHVQHFAFITRAGEPRVDTVEQARSRKLVVLRGSPNLAQLRRHGFADERVAQAASVDDMLRMLEHGMADAIYGGDLVNLYNARLSGRDPAGLQVGLTLESGEVWLAASGGVSEDERQRLLQAHAALQRNGAQERIWARYGVR